MKPQINKETLKYVLVISSYTLYPYIWIIYSINTEELKWPCQCQCYVNCQYVLSSDLVPGPSQTAFHCILWIKRKWAISLRDKSDVLSSYRHSLIITTICFMWYVTWCTSSLERLNYSCADAQICSSPQLHQDNMNWLPRISKPEIGANWKPTSLIHYHK